ncbi:MAG: HD domain-containing protein [Pseudonocardiaceae bacterium]
MSHPFEQTSIWQRALAPEPGDEHAVARERLRSAYLQFRSTVEPLAAEISRSMPMFTDHSIAHADALWDTASLVCGDAFPLNPAEAFVLGGAFLLHDLGMGLASYPRGIAVLKQDPQFADLYASAQAQLTRSDPSADPNAVNRAAHEQTVVNLLRLRHADQAERLITTTFKTSDGEPFYLLGDLMLRHTFGSLIGRIAHSHWLDVSALQAPFGQRRGSCVDHPVDWEIDPLKLACVLRLADATHIDNRRAPTCLHAFRQPTGTSRDHWYFQERLTRPRVDTDRLVYTSTCPFGRDEAAAWWLAYDTIHRIDEELRRVDALSADLARPRFAVRSVAGADSPERLVLYIRTDRWKPFDARLRVSDATQLIANIGGGDLYGQKRWVAMRELIANASDATRARGVYEGGQGGAVTVRLWEERGSWWLEVEDHGIGMVPEAMVSTLTDFGHSRWQSAAMLTDFPGLLAKGFTPTGHFGIGFFAIFMVADEVQVRSLAYEEAPRSTHVLEFRHGVTARPLLRVADVHERLRCSGTVVRAKLRYDPRSMDGLFTTTNRRMSHTQLLHSRLIRMCALADVDIEVQGPDDPQPVRIIQAGDWTRIPVTELFRRIYRRDSASHLDRVIYDGYERLFIDHASELLDGAGNVIGRAIVTTGWESVPPGVRWMRRTKAPIYVGGLESGEMYFCMGAFVGRPLTADRLRAFPVADLRQLQTWLDAQAETVRRSSWWGVSDRWQLGLFIRGFSATAPQLPCAQSACGPLDAEQLCEWATGRDEVFLIALGGLDWFNPRDRPPMYFTFEGNYFDLPDDYLLVDMNPDWLIPEEVSAQPRDERFADAIEALSAWNPCAWWYDTGNFGSVGLAVRTISEAWGLDVVEAVNLMEPLHIQDNGDFRLMLPTEDGGTVRLTAIRMRRSRPVTP